MPLSDSSDLSHKANFVERDFRLKEPLKDITMSKQDFPSSDWQSHLSNIADSEFAVEKIDYSEIPGMLSREILPITDLPDFVADDTFQDQGPGSVEIYKLDLSREKALLSGTTPFSRLPLKNKSKTPKKSVRPNSKTKTTEIKSTTSPKIDHRQFNFFEEQRTGVSVNRDAFGVGGVPELQVGCEGLEASSHKAKRSIGTSDKEGEMPAAWLDVTPISLDLDYDLSYDEETYEEMDELLKLKKLETTTGKTKSNRGDMDATVNNDHLGDFRRSEKLPIRGDLGESSLVNSSGLINSPVWLGIKQDDSRKLINPQVDHEVAKAKRESISSDANDSIRSSGRRLLWLAGANTTGPEDEGRKRAKRSIDWGFGEDEGVVSSDELQTVTERRRQHEMRFHQGATRHDQQREMNSNMDDIRQQYERLLEQKRREEEKRLRQLKQDGQRVSNRREEGEERRREEMRRRQYEEYRRRTEHAPTYRINDEETQRRQETIRNRTRNDQHSRISEDESNRRLEDEETKRRTQEMIRKNNEDRRRQEEEERRQRLQNEEEMRRSHNRWQEEERRKQEQEENSRRLSHKRPEINEERRQRPHEDEMRRREEERLRQEDAHRRHEEEMRSRLQNEETKRQEEYRMRQEETQRRREEEERRRTPHPVRTLSEDDRRRLEERRREWTEKRRQDEENERRQQSLNRHDMPSNITRIDQRVNPNDGRQHDRDENKRKHEQHEREHKLREYITRNRPISINQPDRRPIEENRHHRTEDNRNSQPDTTRENEEYRRRMEEHRKKQEEERKLQEYIRRNQPINVPSRNNQSIGRNWFEQRRLIEEARLRGRYPDPTAARRHGPSAPTNIDSRGSPEEMRRRQDTRRLEDERRQQRYEAEERQKELAREEERERRLHGERWKEATRREEETRRAQSRRYEEDRKRMEAIRIQEERRRQGMPKEQVRGRDQSGRWRQPEARRSPYQDPRLVEHRRRQDSRPIPSNLLWDESRRATERERQKQEQARLVADRRWQEENR